MDSADLLEQLADIHLPGAVPFWPPAPGWWVLTLVVIAVAIWASLRYLQAYRQRQICAHALNELDRVYDGFKQRQAADESALNEARLEYLNHVNAVLRRVAIWHYPANEVASLGGRAWVDFIREKGESTLLTDELEEALNVGRFKPNCDIDADRVHQFGERWIVSLYMKKSGAAGAENVRA